VDQTDQDDSTLRLTIKAILTVSIILFVSTQPSLSQMRDVETVSLHSLENKEINVTIKFDYGFDKLILELNSDEKMIVKGFRGLTQEMKVLNQKFIELRFIMRGGTGVHIRRYVLICVSNNKLYRSIDQISLLNSVFKETYVASIDSLHLYDESSTYQVDFSGLKEVNNSFEMIANEFVKTQSKIDPTQNYENQDTIQLHFDMDNKVFFNKFVNLDGSYLLWSDEDLNEQVNFHNEKFPSICINQGAIYVFFRHKWYIKHEDYRLEDTDFNH
jgi:hypothetical protein